MDDTLKESLKELVTGQRKPQNGMEIHFLNVIKGKNKPCSKDEKEWYRWWLGFSGSSNQLVTTSNKLPKQIKPPEDYLVKTDVDTRYTRRAQNVKNAPRINPNLDRIQREKDAELKKLKDNGPKPIPFETSEKELLKLKVKGETSYSLDEGIGGSREDNKKMRARQWSEIVNRGKTK